MAVPKKKTSKSRRNMRRAHDSLKAIHSVECKNCGTRRLPHNVCPSCGMYRGRQVVLSAPEEDQDSEE